MGDYTAEVGDRVRVTIEGTVKRVNRFDTVQEIRVENDKGETLYFDTDEATVEKVEPEYEVFGPGDVVRSRASGGVRALSLDGYLHVDSGVYYTYAQGISRDYFTSKNFGRVELS